MLMLLFTSVYLYQKKWTLYPVHFRAYVETPIVITCHEHRFKHLNCHYIYRIIPIKKQKGKPDEMNLPLLKNDITGSELTVKILDT
jgi:hypothetical protein